jgi:hypothetical protein
MTVIVEQSGGPETLLPEVLVSPRQFALAPCIFDEQTGCPGDNPDPCYRQIAQMLSCCAQPSRLGPSRCKKKFKIVAALQGHVNRLPASTAEPVPALRRNRNGCGVERDAHRRGLRELPHTISKPIAQVHAARGRTVAPEQAPGTDARLGPEISGCAIACSRVLPKPQQTDSGVSQRPGHIHLVSWSRACACQDFATMHGADSGDIEDHRPRCASDVAANECHTVTGSHREQAIDHLIEGDDLERPGKCQRQQRRSRPGTHRGKVAQVDRQRTMPDGVRRDEPTIEVHALHLCIGGQYFQGAADRLDRRGIVSRADDDPLSGCEASSDASDERVLTAIGYCVRIQNGRATNSPALPCGEVE